MRLKETDKSLRLKQLENDLALEELQWKRKKNLLMRKYSMRKEKQALKRSFLPKVSTTKLFMVFLFLNCTAIEVFTLFVTLREFDLAFNGSYSPDFTPLVTLISVVVSEVIAFAVYSIKSMRENSKGGVVYETTMKSLGDTQDTEPQG